jgi:hypothetical protein
VQSAWSRGIGCDAGQQVGSWWLEFLLFFFLFQRFFGSVCWGHIRRKYYHAITRSSAKLTTSKGNVNLVLPQELVISSLVMEPPTVKDRRQRKLEAPPPPCLSSCSPSSPLFRKMPRQCING